MNEQLQEIKIVRLKTGEDIIAVIENNEDETITIKNAMIVSIDVNQARKQQFMVIRHWLPLQLVEDDVAIVSRSDVLTTLNPSEDFYEYYLNLVTVVESSPVQKISREDEPTDEELYEIEEEVAMMESKLAKENNQLH